MDKHFLLNFHRSAKSKNTAGGQTTVSSDFLRRSEAVNTLCIYPPSTALAAGTAAAKAACVCRDSSVSRQSHLLLSCSR